MDYYNFLDNTAFLFETKDSRKCFGKILGHFSSLHHSLLEVRGEATSINKAEHWNIFKD